MDNLKKEVKMFAALANETRLRILILLSYKELCGCHLEWALNITQAKVSRHLTILKNVGFVKERRNGLRIFYSLVKPETQLEKDIYKHLKSYFVNNYEIIKKDLLNLEKVMCKPIEKITTIRKIDDKQYKEKK